MNKFIKNPQTQDGRHFLDCKMSTLEFGQSLRKHPYTSFSISPSRRVNVLVWRSRNAYVHQAASSRRMAFTNGC